MFVKWPILSLTTNKSVSGRHHQIKVIMMFYKLAVKSTWDCGGPSLHQNHTRLLGRIPEITRHQTGGSTPKINGKIVLWVST